MKVLVTAGSTCVPIDSVRAIGNVFRGDTGAQIARYIWEEGHEVTLLTSSYMYTVTSITCQTGVHLISFRTFDELANLMEREITSGGYDAIIHSAAVSDYRVSQVLIRQGDTFQPVDNTQKISSSHKKLYLELEPTIKLVDQIREPWGFTGTLVKFKLQVGISDEELIEIAKKSLAVSRANYIVANCREWYKQRAYVISADGFVDHISREKLPEVLHWRLK